MSPSAELALTALAVAARAGDADLELRALAQLGLAEVSGGAVDEGLGHLAGATARQASCVGTLTSFEAHLVAGFVGQEVSAGAPVGTLASTLAKAHRGSLEDCAGTAAGTGRKEKSTGERSLPLSQPDPADAPMLVPRSTARVRSRMTYG